MRVTKVTKKNELSIINSLIFYFLICPTPLIMACHEIHHATFYTFYLAALQLLILHSMSFITIKLYLCNEK